MKEVGKRSIKFSGIKGSMIEKEFLETMPNDFHVQNEVKHIFTLKPFFSKYIEVDEIYCRVTNWTVPDEKRWEELVDLLDWRITQKW